MRFTKVKVKNFKALTDLEVDLSGRCNVLVGPNAVGKTTVLDAIRLAKGLLAPRTQNEANQVLFALGAMSPHNPGNFDVAAIANNCESRIEISCGIEFNAEEFALLELPESLAAMATQLVLSNMGRQFSAPTDLVGFLSTPLGHKALDDQRQMFAITVSEIRAGARPATLILHIDSKTGQATSPDPLSAAIIGFLDRRLPPNKTIFSYFPADRAIPAQEQPVQIGPGDANSQLESHNSQPQLKFSRLKNTIFNSVVSGRATEQQEQFKRIFSTVLRGRTLVDVKVSDRALLRIDVRDDEKDRTFTINAMSSGEKGLILTCLLIAQTMTDGGIVLLDEPELHLNPAVCKDVLKCLIEEYAAPKNLQMIICSHSPEILGVAFDRDDCELYHLVSGDELAPVRKQDLEEVGVALRRLGTSQSDGLLYRGMIFVEGEDDSEVLQEGFKSLFQRYIFRELGGRKNVEKEVQLLQAEERRSRNPLKTAFILDNDGKRTSLRSTPKVRVLQWDRRCIENYLLDLDVLTDLAENSDLAKKPITNTAALNKKLKQLAMKQVYEIAFWAKCNELFSDLPLKQRDVQGKSYAELASKITDRVAALKSKFSSRSGKRWESTFAEACQSKETELKAAWDEAWPLLCDGKQLIRAFHNEIGFKEGLPRLKVRIIRAMASGKTTLWKDVEQKLRNLLETPST
ncbi:MAG TPA: AAA family ATPase [Terracidiphilus sp.]|jgi:predicted ATPase|nr:AAA family ATPase [Terracidiphilus sp.]